ncbi:MAG TPA: 3-dehydro-L-gulonate 2-dehydrogenase [Chryseolinea sp.]|nr:3-dehydro-L-gulonate 2-dehydrogenase [Chryseolinea sp.]HPM29272.1 3-dehydro-L-gulonate 2-dehydrogenase [Chryseolinea sp.]
MINSSFVQVLYPEMVNTFFNILKQHGFSEEEAKTCADIFATNSLEGVYTHGVNRFPRFVQYIKDGYIKIDSEAQQLTAIGCMEQWDGQLGPGPLNALQCTNRSMEIATANGLGCVALANTNHWMRGGYYGRHAAQNGFVFIGWTNTLANMPAWGGVDSKLGNNPLVIAVPYQNDAIVLDMAMSQYSYGSLELYSLKNEKLPVPGGFDLEGNLTDDAAAIMKSRNVLPIGYWKGAGMSLLLDILATILSGGLSTAQVSQLPAEHSVSQVFMTIDVSKLNNYPAIEKAIQHILDDYLASVPMAKLKQVRYPGENTQSIREVNLKEGIPVLKKIWNEVLALQN